MSEINKLPNIICLMGPTASGKTALAMRIATEFPCEIISVDSAQIYRGMDIGTAKPDIYMQQQIPHHLLDILDPRDAYSAGQFCEDTKAIIKTILDRNRIPLLVGGTMLYFRALQYGLADLPPANFSIRNKLSQELQEHGLSYLYERLQKLDSVSAARINPHDPQRIQRALELIELTGKTPSELYQQTQPPVLPYSIINIGLIPENRELLHQHITQRFTQMLAQGFIEEVEKLKIRNDLHIDLPALRCVGYRQIWHYLNHELSYADMHEQVLAATRQLAKRQLTWLRSWQELNAFDMQKDNTENKVLDFLQTKVI